MLVPHQREFVESDSRFTILMSGRGGGKTYAMIEAIRAHLRSRVSRPEVILAGYEYSWTEALESLNEEDHFSEPIPMSDTFAWDQPIIDFYPVGKIDRTQLWGRQPSFIGIDNMEMMLCNAQYFHDVIAPLFKGDRGIFRGTVDPNSNVPNWLYEFMERDDVKVINALTEDNPSV